MNKNIVLFWFRQDLRLNDNPALFEASKNDEVIPVYILDNHNSGEYSLGLILVGGYLDIPKEEAFREGVDWLTLAAKQGYPKAQFMLSVMYHSGRGVKQNDLNAYMWASVASINGETNREVTSKIKARLTRDQIEDAQEKATICIKSEYEVC